MSTGVNNNGLVNIGYTYDDMSTNTNVPNALSIVNQAQMQQRGLSNGFALGNAQDANNFYSNFYNSNSQIPSLGMQQAIQNSNNAIGIGVDGNINQALQQYNPTNVKSFIDFQRRNGINMSGWNDNQIKDAYAGFNNNQNALNNNTTTGFQWGQLALAGLNSIWSIYSGNKQLKMAERQLNEMTALNRANFKNTAKAYNANLRDRASGRGTAVMGSKSKQALGRYYDNRKVEETYA